MQMKITVSRGGKKNTDLDSKSYVIADCRSVQQVSEVLNKEFKDYLSGNTSLEEVKPKARAQKA